MKTKNTSIASEKPGAKRWDEWADEDEEEEGEEEEAEEEEEQGEDGKDYSAHTKTQASVFDKSLKLDPGTRGALPREV